MQVLLCSLPLDQLARDKHCSFVRKIVNYGNNSFITLALYSQHFVFFATYEMDQ
jgi:hypothetical protein